MTSEPTATRLRHLLSSSQPLRMGELVLLPRSDGSCELRHQRDTHADPVLLSLHTDPDDALRLRLLDDHNEYRPLRAAPTLRTGWRLLLPDAESVLAALDHFYPALLPAHFAHLDGHLRVTPFSATAARQTGMYRRVANITPEQTARLVSSECHPSKCLRRILWDLSPGQPCDTTHLPSEKFLPSLPADEIPLLCSEACNILVAKARALIKADYDASQARA